MIDRRLITLLIVAACSKPVKPTPVVVVLPVYNPPAEAPVAAAPAPARTQPRDVGAGRFVRDVGDTTIRVLLSSSPAAIDLSAAAALTFTDRAGGYLARSTSGARWRVERMGRRLRAVRGDGSASPWVEGRMYARSGNDGLVSIFGRPYRGDLLFATTDSGTSVINVVRIDDYLRGVVPLEIGTRSLADSAAVQAQAITARSYAYVHLAGADRAYDVTASTQDQVYRGAEAETDVSSQAVESTRTLVLKYAGRVVNAPYSSTCGGTTAAASEIWRSNDEPYLQRVSDQIPGTGRVYCDIAPRYRWSRTIEGAQLNAALMQYLSTYTTVPGRQPGTAKGVAITSHTPSGRVGTLLISTDRGNFSLRGNEVRYVLRPPGGEILNSTYFSVQATPGDDGSVARLTLTGMGYGHGVGMCQWGAIGRARAGQDFRMILRTYYPGTTVGPAQ